MNIVDQVNNINGNGCSLGWPRVRSDHMDALSKVISEQLSEEPEPIAFSNYDALFTESPSSSKTKAKRDKEMKKVAALQRRESRQLAKQESRRLGVPEGFGGLL